MASFDAKAPPKNRWVVQPAHLGKDTIVHYHAAGGDAAALGHALRRNGGDASGGGLAHFYSPPVHLASAYGHLACVELLLSAARPPARRRWRGGRRCTSRRSAATRPSPRPSSSTSRAARRQELPASSAPSDAAGSLFTRPYQHAYSSGSRACAAPIEAVVRDCKAQIYPGGAGGGPKAWGREIDATPAAPKLEPPPKVKPPVDHNATARAALRRARRAPRHEALAQLRGERRLWAGPCRLCDPVAQDARGHRCNTTHSTEQHYAWADVTRAETRKARIKHQRERKEGRLAPGEVPWRSW
ncbi:hypothetical protein JL722_9488 [Aureococcus anophagefferens]|nr:hypothetical protein JL722_9488 [Aureococcus anophagefferens]